MPSSRSSVERTAGSNSRQEWLHRDQLWTIVTCLETYTELKQVHPYNRFGLKDPSRQAPRVGPRVVCINTPLGQPYDTFGVRGVIRDGACTSLISSTSMSEDYSAGVQVGAVRLSCDDFRISSDVPNKHRFVYGYERSIGMFMSDSMESSSEKKTSRLYCDFWGCCCKTTSTRDCEDYV